MQATPYQPSPIETIKAMGEGVLLINKPPHWTSFDVVKKVRGILGIKKVGHAGTLDPLATGLLILCIGKATKKINHFQELKKVYTGTIELGKTTPSMDLETPFENKKEYNHLTTSAIHTAAQNFVGAIQQIPPTYSAIKVGGKRSYTQVRQGKQPILEPRKVTIHQLTIQEITLPKVKFEVTCSKGTYIRSLAHDLGQSLGVGGYLHTLCRESIGDYSLQDAHDI